MASIIRTSALVAILATLTNAQTYNASFTHYGSGDSFGSPNCNTATAACGFFTSPGFSAAVSQNVYGAAPGAGAGAACGTCYRLTGNTDTSGNALANGHPSIVVMINNLCPATGNPLCAMGSTSDTNQYGANVDFDLCSDSGAAAAMFPDYDNGNGAVGLIIGTAEYVSCSEWSGTEETSGTAPPVTGTPSVSPVASTSTKVPSSPVASSSLSSKSSLAAANPTSSSTTLVVKVSTTPTSTHTSTSIVAATPSATTTSASVPVYHQKSVSSSAGSSSSSIKSSSTSTASAVQSSAVAEDDDTCEL
ncbi:MAG: hypothetical protein M1827_001287 [Pycnora praestabilis]|nr:MAG: hypothetical protein M1827_001287 [Pycnora praestabilis]